MMKYITEPLSREEVKKAIEHGSPKRVPMVLTKFWGEGLREQYGNRLAEFDKYPEDVCMIQFPYPWFDYREDGFYWHLEKKVDISAKGLDNAARMPDWDMLDYCVKNPPNTDAEHLWDEAIEKANEARRQGKYILMHHWSLMFERIWTFRGMENLLVDYIEEPENVHKLNELVLSTELKLLKDCAEKIHPDGYMISDDLGSQHSLLMNPKHFKEFLYPYYKRLWGLAHQYGMHTWLHTCGCIKEVIGDLIDAGLDVLHPIQKHTMDWDEIATQWKGKITFMVGMDVQQTLQQATPEEVREEVRLMKRTFSSPEGGMIIASGNGIVAGTPFENIDAFLDESCKG